MDDTSEPEFESDEVIFHMTPPSGQDPQNLALGDPRILASPFLETPRVAKIPSNTGFVQISRENSSLDPKALDLVENSPFSSILAKNSSLTNFDSRPVKPAVLEIFPLTKGTPSHYLDVFEPPVEMDFPPKGHVSTPSPLGLVTHPFGEIPPSTPPPRAPTG